MDGPSNGYRNVNSTFSNIENGKFVFMLIQWRNYIFSPTLTFYLYSAICK